MTYQGDIDEAKSNELYHEIHEAETLSDIIDSNHECWSCGTAIPVGKKYCETHCGHPADEFDDFTGKCGSCGKSINVNMMMSMAESKASESSDEIVMYDGSDDVGGVRMWWDFELPQDDEKHKQVSDTLGVDQNKAWGFLTKEEQSKLSSYRLSEESKANEEEREFYTDRPYNPDEPANDGSYPKCKSCHGWGYNEIPHLGIMEKCGSCGGTGKLFQRESKANEGGTSNGAKKGWLSRQRGKKFSDEEDLKKQIKPYNDNWTDDQFEDNEWKKDQLEQVRIKNGTHTKHDYSDYDSKVFNPEKDHYEQVCGHCGKVQGSHGRKGHGMTESVASETNGYIAFYEDQQTEIYADTSYDAQKKAIDFFNPPESKKHTVTVMIAEQDGEQITHTFTEAKLKDGYAQCPKCNQQFSSLQWVIDHLKEQHGE